MFRFEWTDLVTPELLAELSALTAEPAGAALTDPLAAVLRASGGLPFARSDWSAEHRGRVARRLLHEATTALLRRQNGFTEPGVGVWRADQGDGAQARTKIDVNRATAAELDALPLLGPTLAARIVESRRRDGAFSSAAELADRISGVGSASVAALDELLAFIEPGRSMEAPGEGHFHDDFRRALRLHGPLANLLETLAVFTATRAHPATLAGIVRPDLEPDELGRVPELPLVSERVEVLADSAYLEALVPLLESATDEIRVCMFFIALGGDDHPTRKVLEVLRAKQAAGVRVRALVDRDRPDDPYGSTIVNANAARFLKSSGVTVHHDPSETLLHSKFVVVDTRCVVIGSHNWTAGSFARYRDLSLSLTGAEVARAWQKRFESLWGKSQPFG